MADLRSDVELGRLDLQLGDLIDCCSFRGRAVYQARDALEATCGAAHSVTAVPMWLINRSHSNLRGL